MLCVAGMQNAANCMIIESQKADLLPGNKSRGV